MIFFALVEWNERCNYKKTVYAFCRSATQHIDNCHRKESENKILNGHGLDKIGEKEAFLKAVKFCVDRRWQCTLPSVRDFTQGGKILKTVEPVTKQ